MILLKADHPCPKCHSTNTTRFEWAKQLGFQYWTCWVCNHPFVVWTDEKAPEKPREKAIGSHQSARMITDEWLTPPWILSRLGPFDLDPCAPINRPWNMADQHYTVLDDGLKLPWRGRVWCNPPYGSQAGKWLAKLAHHGDGIALIFARTETAFWFESIWPKATALLFLQGRVHFCHPNGRLAKANCGAPSVLIAYGEGCANRLKNSGIRGAFVRLKEAP